MQVEEKLKKFDSVLDDKSVINQILNGLFLSKEVKEKVYKTKLYSTGALIALSIVGIGFIIVGGLKQNNKALTISFIVIGVLLIIFGFVSMFLFIYTTFKWINKNVVKTKIDNQKTLHVYLTYLNRLDKFEFYQVDSYFDENNYLHLNGVVKSTSELLKVNANKEKIEFYLNNELINTINQNTHNYSSSLNLKLNAADSFKTTTNENILKFIEYTWLNNLETIIKDLMTTYGK